MCGIFGLVTKKEAALNERQFHRTVEMMFRLSESRGKEASGMALRTSNTLQVYKEPIPGTQFIKRSKFEELVRTGWQDKKEGFSALIGHSRLMTNGRLDDNRNNQPVTTQGIVGIHNGIIVNDEDIWRSQPEMKRQFEVDSEVIFSLLRRKHKIHKNMVKPLAEMYSELEGSASIAAMFNDAEELVLASNTGSLYFIFSEDKNIFAFASEKFILRELIKKAGLESCMGQYLIEQVKPLTGCQVSLSNLKIKRIDFGDISHLDFVEKNSGESDNKQVDIKDVSLYQAALENFKKSVKVTPLIQKFRVAFDQNSIEGRLRRCSSCLLPHTFPHIVFDDLGVCNYCNNYRPIQPKDPRKLEELVDPLRHSSAPNCIVALSGGRDSTYGLHYIKNELGLNPIAYTYDWGMVEDIARRSCSRICGKLGVEHIVVSADILRKRANIKKNVKAWLKRPELGMVPLFMAGDKQFYYYANILKKQTGISLFFFCAGNELEKTDFKTGFVGIEGGSSKGILNSISLVNKIKMAGYFGKQFILNPAYFNSSLYDSLHAFFSSYFIEHDFRYLYHHIKWNEEEIMNTLRSEYGWEDARDTKASWRIGDGTSAFYNLI